MKNGDLVQITSRASDETAQRPVAEGVSRRSFLKILGATSALGAAGCVDDARQNVFPYVKGEVEQIPGVPVWYRSTCAECQAGCGVQVRTREGRAVKIEGSTASPINTGGLCALGQSALQGLYDPDRVRQPLKRVRVGSDGRPVYEPISWDDAYALVAKSLTGTGRKALLCGESTGAMRELQQQFSESCGVERAVYDPSQEIALAQASKIVFGKAGVPHFKLGSADVVLTLGADLLETFVSPVEHARDWAKTRKSDKPLCLITAEPRLSLTGANADLWLCLRPGTELQLALYLSRKLLDSGRNGIPADAAAFIRERTEGLTKDRAAELTGIPAAQLDKLAALLQGAKFGLVIAGGVMTATAQSVELQVVSLLLSAQLGALEGALNIDELRTVEASLDKVTALAEGMKRQEVSLLFVHGANPVFTLPAGFGDALKQVPMVVSLASHRNETTDYAHLILPSHTWLESWGDVRPYDGVFSLQQPAMMPVFDTRALGDLLLDLAARSGKAIVQDGAQPATFEEYLKGSWKKVHKARRVTNSFDVFWSECVEHGGYFPGLASVGQPRVSFAAADARALDFAPKSSGTDLTLVPFERVLSFDGRAANRPWLQEIPDPLSKVVWDAWAELHPETAKQLGVESGDIISVRTQEGALELPAVLTPRIFRDVVAVPLGQGHSSMGRYAAKVGGAVNPFSILPAGAVAHGMYALQTAVKVSRSRGRSNMVVTQGSFSQQGRELARTTWLDTAGDPVEEHEESHHHASEAQFYEQREHPVYEWGMVVDLAACTGCSACVAACYAENNIAVVGKEQCGKGREMSWIRIEAYDDGSADELTMSFLPMMCQQCHNAPCEPVCPVYASYHNEEGLNAQVYNRCVGTRYCSNNCPYKVRRFNWYQYDEPAPLSWQLNPDVVKRSVGVMEKCTFCIQRIVEAKDIAKDLGRTVQDGEVQPACMQGCPTKAISFGNMKDPNSEVMRLKKDKRAYKVLDEHINTQPAVTYLERVRYKV